MRTSFLNKINRRDEKNHKIYHSAFEGKRRYSAIVRLSYAVASYASDRRDDEFLYPTSADFASDENFSG